MPDSTEIFGGKELHRDRNPHYHTVLRFSYRVNWQDARKKLMVTGADGDVDTEAIRIVVPDKTESVGDFLRRTQSYCAKNHNPWLFRERFGNGVIRCEDEIHEEDTDVQAVGGTRGERRHYTECSCLVSVGVVCFCAACVERVWQVRK